MACVGQIPSQYTQYTAFTWERSRERERERAHRNSADMFPRVFRVTQHGCPVAFELIEALSELLRLHEEEPKT